jgi:hypothetical protein
MTGYIDSDDDLTEHIAACDVALTLRWPTAREISGPWLRCLAAGMPTIIVHLAHLVDVPALDPRTWEPHSVVPGFGEPSLGNTHPELENGKWESGHGKAGTGSGEQGLPAEASTAAPNAGRPFGRDPVCVAVDILDEGHSLRLAMRRLAHDAALRDALGRAGQSYWAAEHSLARMVEDYRRLIPMAMARPTPEIRLPAHLHANADETLHRLLGPLGVPSPLR